MTIEEDLAKWLSSRPVWQQRLVDGKAGPAVTVKAADVPGAAWRAAGCFCVRLASAWPSTVSPKGSG
ncbi:hypothetical protein [Kribbella yunnanensis]|uniref:hypothetical protein n=1 Tax=Kribbella yunnanensis TaxID=190194 RepID=UPI0031CFA927